MYIYPGVLNMTHLKATNTHWLEHCTHVMVVLATGMDVTGMVVRQTSTIWTPMQCVLSLGIQMNVHVVPVVGLKHNIYRCTINTNNWYQLVHTQNNDKSNIWVEQDGREYSFEICNDGGYRSRMAQSYDNMVWSGSLWGGGGIDMSWLDGMTGCWGDCNIDGSSVTFSNFRLTDEGAGIIIYHYIKALNKQTNSIHKF